MKFIRYFTAADQPACYYTVCCEKSGIPRLIGQSGPIISLLNFFHRYTVKKVKYYADWSERSTQVGRHGIIEMIRTGFRELYFFSYFIQCTSHDFENNRKTMLIGKESATTQVESESASSPILTRKVSPLLFSTLTACLAGVGRAYSSWKRLLKSDILTLTKEVIDLMLLLAHSCS